MPEKPEISKVKGAMLVPLAKIINGLKDKNWVAETDLTEQDMKMIKAGILPSAWYDLSLLERMGSAAYKIAGGGKPEGAFMFGAGIMVQTLFEVYKSPLMKNDPKEILARFINLYNGSWFNNGVAEVEFSEETSTIQRYLQPVEVFNHEYFVYMLKGVLTKIVQANGGRNVQVKLEEEALLKSQKITQLTFHISWEA